MRTRGRRAGSGRRGRAERGAALPFAAPAEPRPRGTPRPPGPRFAGPSSPLSGRPLGMDLNGFLLDEEGAFSLGGFQEFTVRPCRGAPAPIPAAHRAFPVPCRPSGAPSAALLAPVSWPGRAPPPAGPALSLSGLF